jgi:multidrug resistance efflux pump
MQQDLNNIENSKRVVIDNNPLRSEPMQEILSRQPSFMAKWALLFFASILLLLLAATWFIRYPDLVTAKAKLNSVNAAKEVVTKTEGRLVTILVKENDTVQKGQILGFMESIAQPNAIFRISKQIDSINTLISQNKTDKIIANFPNYSNQQLLNQLGELQTNYQTFIQSFITFKDYLSNGFYLRKRNMLATDMVTIQKQTSILVAQKELLEKDLALSNETFNANKSLAKEKVISSMDYRNEESKLISKKLSLPQINASIIANEAQQNEKKKEIAELENQITVQKSVFIQALQTIKSQIQAWEFKYLLKSPVSGKISFTGFFQENQEVKLGQYLFYVQPTNTVFFIEMLIPQYNFGKVKIGQEVLLKFQAYPYEQYGAVIGKIEYINTTPSDSGYLAKVVLPNGLVTNYKKSLQYRNGLFAQADIITQNRRLLERFYDNLVKQIQR